MSSPVWTEVGCDADAVIKLINQGMSLTQRSLYFNETVLHYWAGGHYFWNTAKNDGISYQEDSLRVVKLLTEKGADLLALDKWGFTPLLEAANGPHHGDLPNLKVLDFLLEREEYSRAEKIEAMELAGAVILQNVKHSSLFHKAFDYWRSTLHLRRQMEADYIGFIEKPRLNLKNLQTNEWNTSAELEDVIEHPDKFVIQSFLVRLRIFSSKRWSAMNSLFGSNILYDFIRELQQQLRFVEIFDIIRTILGTLLSRSDLRENEDAQCKMGRIVNKLIDVLTYLEESTDLLTEEIMTTSLDLMASATELHFPILCSLIPFAKILSRLKKPILMNKNKDPFEALSRVRYQRGENLLHKAIRGLVRGEIGGGNLYAAVRLLLYAGCDPNAIDDDGNAPLHCLAQINVRYWLSYLNIIAELLLDFGAQLSRKNADGKTAVDLMIRKHEIYRNLDVGQEIIGWKLPDWCTSELPRLTCLTARVIRRNRIPHLKLPVTLINMIDKHKIIE